MSFKQLLGEYEVRLDGKGRFRMPSGLLTQLGDWQRGNFVINRGFELIPRNTTADVTDEYLVKSIKDMIHNPGIIVNYLN